MAKIKIEKPFVFITDPINVTAKALEVFVNQLQVDNPLIENVEEYISIHIKRKNTVRPICFRRSKNNE